jgi:hypothetical protein
VKPIRVRSASGESLAVGRLVDEAFLVSREDTVLDPNICRAGAIIQLPEPILDIYNRTIDKVYYPAFSCDQIQRFIILNDLAIAANRILKIIEEMTSGAADVRVLELSVRAFQLAAVNMLSGKTGLISANVISSRTSNSGRAVLIPSGGERHPNYVGIPERIMVKLGIDEEEPVIVGRDPTIWHGSLEVLRAYCSGNDCIELHPLVFSQMGADSDGDQVYVYKIPETGECYLEALEQVGAFTKNHAKWPGWLSKAATSGEEVDWDNVVQETQDRARITGFSVSPREILEKGPRVKSLCKAISKEPAIDECQEIARGISKERVRQYLLEQNATQLNMKVWLGPIGAASNRLKVVAGEDKGLLESAMYVSERLQQMLLSSKHVVGGEKKEAYSVKDALGLLNRQGKHRNTDLRTALAEIEKMGLDSAKAKPIMTHIWVGYAALKTAAHFLGQSPMARSRTRAGDIQRLVHAINFGEISGIQVQIKKILETLRLCKLPVTFEEFRARFAQENLGLSEICNRDFPIFDLCSASRPEPVRAELAKRVVLQGEKDPVGIGRMTLELAQKEVQGHGI